MKSRVTIDLIVYLAFLLLIFALSFMSCMYQDRCRDAGGTYINLELFRVRCIIGD